MSREDPPAASQAASQGAAPADERLPGDRVVSPAEGAAVSAGRNTGLDLVRAVAILLVLASHSLIFFFPRYFPSLVVPFILFGFLGVELFFVLSGLLIGRILLHEVVDEPGGKALVRFWVRRWARTLPPYYVVLTGLLLAGRNVDGRHYLFLQFLYPDGREGFSVSWSLVIEEWFYLLVPPLALLAGAWPPGKRGRAFLGLLSCVLVLPTIARWVIAAHTDISFMEVSSNPLLRLDSLAVGVSAAAVQRYRPDLWALADRHRTWLAVLGGGGILLLTGQQALLIAEWTLNQSFFARVPLLIALSTCIGLLVVACDRSRRLNGTFASSRLARTVRLVSVSSYAAYLLHSLAFEPFFELNRSSRSDGRTLLLLAGALASTGIVSVLFYRWFEIPVLRLRDRWTREREPRR